MGPTIPLKMVALSIWLNHCKRFLHQPSKEATVKRYCPAHSGTKHLVVSHSELNG